MSLSGLGPDQNRRVHARPHDLLYIALIAVCSGSPLALPVVLSVVVNGTVRRMHDT